MKNEADNYYRSRSSDCSKKRDPLSQITRSKQFHFDATSRHYNLALIMTLTAQAHLSQKKHTLLTWTSQREKTSSYLLMPLMIMMMMMIITVLASTVVVWHAVSSRWKSWATSRFRNLGQASKIVGICRCRDVLARRRCQPGGRLSAMGWQVLTVTQGRSVTGRLETAHG